MTCADWREALSAVLDGEESGTQVAAVEAHLERCAGCRAWREAATRATRVARVAPVEAVPDLVNGIVAAARPLMPAPDLSPSPGVWRLGLALVALAQVLVAVPLLLGLDPSTSVHVAREEGAWQLAFAAGLAFVAHRPARAASLVPVVAVLVGAHLLTTGVDVAGGDARAGAEGQHLLLLFGLAFLWALRRAPAEGGGPSVVASS